MPLNRKRYAIICGSYINAYGLVASLRAVGWQDSIVCIKEEGCSAVLTEVLGPDVETWAVRLNQPVDLLYALAARIPADRPKVIFFCCERFLEAFRDQGTALLPNSRFLLGSPDHLDTILDRFSFYRFIDRNRLAAVPKTIAGHEDPWATFGRQFFVRPKRSWLGLRRAPRVQRITGREEQHEVEALLKGFGLQRDDWCYQEVLSLDPKDNVSVCGWHSPGERLYFATRHLLRHPSEVGNGDLTEIIPAPEGLLESTRRILDTLDYEGPFELEFVLDQATGEYKVIELNPRFWMQHGLIEAATGHGLVGRYLGKRETTVQPSDVRYWVNTFYALFRLLKGDWRVLRYLRDKRSVAALPWPVAFWWLPYYAVQKVKTRLVGLQRKPST